MATVTNYYEELGLSPEMSIEEIGSKLDQLETVWSQRMFNEPEKSNEVLALVSEARDLFASNEAKGEYDRVLNNTASATDANNAAVVAYDKAKAGAVNFFNSKQWDLAKNAIDKALQNVESISADDAEKADTYELARKIYFYNGLFAQAVDFSNKAIELLPDVALNYANKALTLNELNTQMRNCGQDTSRVFKNFQTTCQIWVEKAKQAQDHKLASMGLDTLARSYVDAREYALMDKYASEALTLDPENTGAQEVLNFLGRTREVDISELQTYYNEKSPYVDDIKRLANQIASSGIKPTNPRGWVLYQALSYMEDDKPWGQYEQRVDVFIVLTTDGEFKMIENWRYGDNHYKSGGGEDSKTETRTYENCLDLAMIAMDFKADFYIGNDDDPGYHFEHTTDVLKVSTKWERGTLIRYGSIKGKGLYTCLKNIVDQAAEQIERQKKYEEECSRINAAFNSEYEPLKAEINADYASKSEALQRERIAAIENAKQQEAQRTSIQNQIDAMLKELSSLGFFAGKKKRELQAKIDNSYRSMSELVTVASVTSHYDNMAAELGDQERNTLAQLEKDLRAKYPLPTLE